MDCLGKSGRVGGGFALLFLLLLEFALLGCGVPDPAGQPTELESGREGSADSGSGGTTLGSGGVAVAEGEAGGTATRGGMPGTGGAMDFHAPAHCELPRSDASLPDPFAQNFRSRQTHEAVFSIETSQSAVVATVAIVEWSVNQPILSAFVEFGRDREAPELFAPVDLAEPHARTLLLGMKSGRQYTFRVVAEGCSGERYVSQDVEVTAGTLPVEMPSVVVHQMAEGASFGGFTVTCNGYGNLQGLEQPRASSWAMILDQDGDYVWGVNLADTPLLDCSRARFSHDGRHLWLGNTSTSKPTGVLRRMTLDGLEIEDFELPARHHDFTVLPSGHVLYFEQQNGGGVFDETEGPDSVFELDPETAQSRLVYDQARDFAELFVPQGSHTNSITYVPHLSAFSVSMLYPDTIALLSYPEAELLGVFGGDSDEFGVSWTTQHDHQFLNDSFLVFNNWATVNSSALLEYSYDLSSKVALERETYVPDPPLVATAFGGVQRLPGGNTVVTFSTNGVIHELDPSKNLLRETVIGAALGYATRRSTLYGPPPHLLYEL